MSFAVVRDSVFRFTSDTQPWPLDDDDYANFLNLSNICFLEPFPEKEVLTDFFFRPFFISSRW